MNPSSLTPSLKNSRKGSNVSVKGRNQYPGLALSGTSSGILPESMIPKSGASLHLTKQSGSAHSKNLRILQRLGTMSDIDGLRMIDRKSRKSLNQQGLTKLLQDKSSSHLGSKGGIPKPFPTATAHSKNVLSLVGYKKQSQSVLATFSRGASCSSLVAGTSNPSDAILIQTKNSSSSTGSNDNNQPISSISPSQQRAKKMMGKKMYQGGSSSNLTSKSVHMASQGDLQLIAAYNQKKLKINPLFHQAKHQVGLPKGNSSQSPLQRSGFVGSMLSKKGAKIPSGQKYQQNLPNNKSYSVLGPLPPNATQQQYTTPSTPSKSMLLNATSQLALKQQQQGVDHSLQVPKRNLEGKSSSSSSSGGSFNLANKMGKKPNRQAFNTLVLNESASGVNKEELEQEEVRPSNLSNMRTFFPQRSGTTGTTHFNLSFNNSFNTQFPPSRGSEVNYHTRSTNPQTTKHSVGSTFQFESPDRRRLLTTGNDEYLDTEGSETAQVAAKLEENFTNRLRELRDTPKPLLNLGDKTTSSMMSDSSELRLRVVSETFEEVIIRDPCFSSLLTKIKEAYEEFIRDSTSQMSQQVNQSTKRYERQLTELEGDHMELEKELLNHKRIESQL